MIFCDVPLLNLENIVVAGTSTLIHPYQIRVIVDVRAMGQQQQKSHEKKRKNM